MGAAIKAEKENTGGVKKKRKWGSLIGHFLMYGGWMLVLVVVLVIVILLARK